MARPPEHDTSSGIDSNPREGTAYDTKNKIKKRTVESQRRPETTWAARIADHGCNPPDECHPWWTATPGAANGPVGRDLNSPGDSNPRPSQLQGERRVRLGLIS